MKKLFLLVILILSTQLFAVKLGLPGENVYLRGDRTGIGVDTTEAPEALLDLRAEDDGILIPRLSNTQRDAIVDPPTGLMIYNTDCNIFNFYNGSLWASFPLPSDLEVGPIMGDDDFCEGDGDIPFSITPVADATDYIWTLPEGSSITSGSGTAAIIADIGTTGGNICVTVITPCASVEDCMAISVSESPVGGAVTGGSTIDIGDPTPTLTLSGYSGTIARWQRRLDGGTWTDISHTATSYSETPSLSGNWDYRAVITSPPCAEVYSDFTTVEVVGAPSGSVTFNYTGSEQTWTVPSGVASIDIECRGAQGGSSMGGEGGISTGTLAVTPGEILYVYVGGQGSHPAGGWNGGGNGSYWYGGGGASDVRQGGNTYSDRVIVAGGGGGAYSSSYRGGHGGGLTGENATWSNYGSERLPYGGTQSAGGRYGGGFGEGGDGESYDAVGGGGGWYGGGSNTGIMQNCTGAGGSGYIDGVSGGITSLGGNTGNGQVTIDW